jgi:hypothetical protein
MRYSKMRFFLPVLFGLGTLFTSCSSESTDTEPTDAEGYRIYTIQKDGHYADNRDGIEVKTQKMDFSVIFDSSAIYTTKDPVNQYDINKLYGLSDCNSQHHQNSARMGWRWVNNKLEIHGYAYKNSSPTAKSELITAIPLGQKVNMSIEMLDSTYLFRVNDKFVELSRGCNGIGEGYKLYPYFGGDENAPHDIIIKVKDL